MRSQCIANAGVLGSRLRQSLLMVSFLHQQSPWLEAELAAAPTPLFGASHQSLSLRQRVGCVRQAAHQKVQQAHQILLPA